MLLLECTAISVSFDAIIRLREAYLPSTEGKRTLPKSGRILHQLGTNFKRILETNKVLVVYECRVRWLYILVFDLVGTIVAFFMEREVSRGERKPI